MRNEMGEPIANHGYAPHVSRNSDDMANCGDVIRVASAWCRAGAIAS